MIGEKILKKLAAKNIELIERNGKMASAKCLVCGHTWTMYYSNLVYRSNSKCPECHKKEMRLSDQDIKDMIKDRPMILLEKYKGSIQKSHIWKCLKCDKTWEATIASIYYYNCGCPECRKLNNKIINNRLINCQLEIIGKYSNNYTKTQFVCHKCNHTWLAIPNLVLQRKSCPNCTKLKVIQNAKDNLAIKNLELLGEYEEWNKKTSIRCKRCGHVFQMSISKSKGCLECSTGKNERLTGEYLKEIFPDTQIFHHLRICVDKKRYFTIDYSMNVLGAEYIIEYNGQQHYNPTKFRQKITDEDALKKFKKQQCRDRKLRKYCKKNNIILIEIDGRKYKNQKIKAYLQKVF